jgi:allantoinase
LFQDDQPQPLKTKTGKLISMLYSLEVNDLITYGALAMSPDRYADVLMRHFDQLLEEEAESGEVMCIPLYAYLVSQSHRIKAFEPALAYICSYKDDVWYTTAVEITDRHRTRYWDATLADIAGLGLTRLSTAFDQIVEG